ncbi:MAG: hypothetical protein H0V18_14730 [Pyrinomonadaceae bacterium]|nr:hypothetical protein [Pyrinomonadaceae bacterium]
MPEHIKVVNLNCTSCGGALEIAGDMERFSCGYCGSALMVQRRGGTIGLSLVGDAVARVQVGTEKTAAELALVRLDKELATARARWHEAEKWLLLQNKAESGASPGLVILIVSVVVLLLAIYCFGS